MTGADVRRWCRQRPETTEEFPFGPTARVFKVSGLMFALMQDEGEPETVVLKCDPRYALDLREGHPDSIGTAYHFNKRHWNSVRLDGSLSRELILELLDHSYSLVVAKLPRAARDRIRALAGFDPDEPG
ncbi:MAG TPA: MmcQ/YjbR family DNA-binding protein [Candidatus Dormibacteraeota bacterium]|jgi:predicted DNA-binding protein (MmcQ/YjbR family)|nr:MmcQ/YjbR family DNA-binding protein [Candidatus Dormibacteraeota bacterium]